MEISKFFQVGYVAKVESHNRICLLWFIYYPLIHTSRNRIANSASYNDQPHRNRHSFLDTSWSFHLRTNYHTDRASGGFELYFTIEIALPSDT
jgi:hypothetical protein